MKSRIFFSSNSFFFQKDISNPLILTHRPRIYGSFVTKTRSLLFWKVIILNILFSLLGISATHVCCLYCNKFSSFVDYYLVNKNCSWFCRVSPTAWVSFSLWFQQYILILVLRKSWYSEDTSDIIEWFERWWYH